MPTASGQYGSDQRLSDYRPVLAVSVDGRRAISASLDATLWVWDLTTGQCVHTLTGRRASDDPNLLHCQQMIHGVAITPDGRLAVSRTLDDELRVWDLDAAVCLRVLRPGGEVTTGFGSKAVAMTADGRSVLSADPDAIRSWDLAAGDRVSRFEYPADVARGGPMPPVALAVDRGAALSLGPDHAVVAWTIPDGRTLAVLEGHRDRVTALALTPDGRFAVSGGADRTLRVWAMESGTPIGAFEHDDMVMAVAVTGDGRFALAAARDDSLRIWDVERGALLRTIRVRWEHMGTIAIAPDGASALSAGSDTVLRLWDVERGLISDASAELRGISHLSTGREGRAVIACGSAAVRVIDATAGTPLSTLRESVTQITPDGTRALALAPGDFDADQRIVVWDLRSTHRLWTLDGHAQAIIGLGVTADSRRAVSWSHDKTLRVWDLDQGVCLRTEKTAMLRGEVMRAVDDGRGMLVWDRGDSVALVDVDTLRSVTSVPAWYVGTPVYAALSPDGAFVTLGCREANQMHCWDLSRRRRFRELNRGGVEAHTERVWSWSLSPDGRHAVSASNDCTVGIWDVATGACVRRLAGHQHWVVGAVVTPDGRHVVSWSWDRTIRVWDFATGECRLVAAQPAGVTALEAHPDRVVAGDAEGKVTFLRLDNLEGGAPIVTAVRRYDRARAEWDDRPVVHCPWCGGASPVPSSIETAITAIHAAANLSSEPIPCLDLPQEVWADASLHVECPRCAHPIRYNPFVLDHRDWYTAFRT
jgi:WD40 repeat protein